MNCPCGGGQSCIVHRRSFGDWVHEDDIFWAAGLPVRKDCATPLTDAQKRAMGGWLIQSNSPSHESTIVGETQTNL